MTEQTKHKVGTHRFNTVSEFSDWSHYFRKWSLWYCLVSIFEPLLQTTKKYTELQVTCDFMQMWGFYQQDDHEKLP